MKKKLISDFYNLEVKQLIDKRIWDLPILEKNEDIHNVLNILGAKNHIWIVKDKKSKELVGVITEHDVLSILAPKRSDVKSIHHGTAKIAGDIMSCREIISCKKDEKIVDVLEKMTKHQLRRLPVLEDYILIGEITLNQLIRKYYDASQYHFITNKEEG